MALARRGDANAFGTLVLRHQEMVYALALQELHQPTEAEEAAQDAFVRAFTRLGALRKPASFGAWVGGIAIRVAREIRRARDRSQALAGEMAAPSPADSRRDAQLILVRRLVAALPERYRVPLTLRYVEGLSYAEIGARLRIREASARSRVFRGREKIRGQLVPSR